MRTRASLLALPAVSSTLKPARKSASMAQRCVFPRFEISLDVRCILRLPSASSHPAADMQLTPHSATADGRRHSAAVRQLGAVQAPEGDLLGKQGRGREGGWRGGGGERRCG
jgi:hypothetical protein